MLIRKSQPAQQDVHIDAMLTNLSIAYMQSQDLFISNKVFPIVNVDKQSDKYWVFPKNDWLRDEAEKRADSTESAGGGYTLSSDSYFCDVWAFHKDLGAQTRANQDAALNLERGAVQFVTQRLLMRQEVQWISDFFTTNVWGTDATPSNLWSNYATSDPIEDVEAAKEAILSVTGYMPNTMVMGYQVFRKLKNHPDIVDRMKYTTNQNITADIVARMLEIDNLYISRSIRATNLENETAAYGFNFGKHALLCYTAPSPGIMQPSAGYTFAWTGVSGGLGTSVGVDSFDIRAKKTVRYEGEIAFSNKVVGRDLGYFFNGAVA